MLPSNKFLLSFVDICHNFLPNRKYDTIAIGAVGISPFRTKLVLGINSSTFTETTLTKDRLIPPTIRNSAVIKALNVELLQEPYHAETSIVLYAKENKLKIFGLASSRKICDTCAPMLVRFSHLLDDDCVPVDAWAIGTRLITQKERSMINDFDSHVIRGAVAVREQ